MTDALGYLREGDTLVVTKLDRLGRIQSFFHGGHYIPSALLRIP